MFDPDDVQLDFVSIQGYAEPHTPAQYNKTAYVRYVAPAGMALTDTIFVLMPGLFSGGAGLDLLARQLVASRPGSEVWVIDRRANLLEDRSAMIASLESGDPSIAFEYYVTNLNTEDGFQVLAPEEVAFMGYWGLDVHLRDLHEVVLRAERAADTVILGGHSLGASIVSYYSSYDFGVDTPDVGYTHIDGLLLYDGALGRTGSFDWQDDNLRVYGIELIASQEQLESGEAPPYITELFDPATEAAEEVRALLAYLAPTQLSPGGWVSYPATNRAVLGILGDDDYTPSPVFGASMGVAVNAEFGGNLVAALLDGRTGFSSRSVTGVKTGELRVSWSAGDLQKEVVDIDALAKSRSQTISNYDEWYFPLRLGLDIIQLDVALESAEGFVPTREVLTPTLALGAERGLCQDLEAFAAYRSARGIGAPFAALILDGFTHVDVVSARNNPAVTVTLQWLDQVALYAR